MEPLVLKSAKQQPLWQHLYLAFDEEHRWSAQQAIDSLYAQNAKGEVDQSNLSNSVEESELVVDESVESGSNHGSKAKIFWDRHKSTSYPAIGYTNATVWAAVKVLNNTSQTQMRLISIDNTALDDVDIFVLSSDGELEYFRAGNLIKPEDRWNLSFVPSGALVVPANDSAIILLRVQSKTSIHLPLYAWEVKEFSADQRSFIAAEMLFYGLIISLVISQIIQFVIQRQPLSFWYVFTGLSVLLFFSSVQGVGALFIWGDWGTFARDVFVYSLILLAFSLVGLGLELLRIKEWRDKVFLATKVCQYFLLSWVLWLFLFDYRIAVISLMLFSTTLVFAICLFGVRQWHLQTRAGRYFIASWGLFLLAGCLFMLAKLNVIDWSGWYIRMMQFAMVIQLLVFYYYQATSVAKNQEDLVMQKEEALVLEKNYTLRLKQEVEESQAALKLANRQLEEFHIIDGLSGAFNRAYFNREFPIELKRATREQFHLSLVIIDIIELNVINERYGHLAGDKCIRFLSETIARVAQRDTDWHARFSDDSFVVVLSTTNAIDAQALVQKIIEHTQHELPLRDNELSIHFAIKAAFVSGIPNRELSSSDWIDYLYSALTRVKQMDNEDFWSYEF
ncbi:MAG: GGDEF domain-containing protein [Gammaproteobacteria bacterium]|nr:GGDEF domain-containing protein [Gammaproteobacteria bacterium]